MEQGKSLKMRFYEQAYASARSVWGAVLLDAASPVLAELYNPITHSKSAQDYLEELGYDPDIFDKFASHSVRILTRDYEGFFSAVGLFKNSFLLKKNLDGAGNAMSLSNSYLRASDYNDHQFIIMPEPEGLEYSTVISNLSGLPPKFLDGVYGDTRSMIALILAHEIGHHSHTWDNLADGAPKMKAEYGSDRHALDVLQEIESPVNYAVTKRDLIKARGSGAILYALANFWSEDLSKKSLEHATALFLSHDYDGRHDEVFEAHWRMVKRLHYYNLTADRNIPLFINTYLSAQDILESEHDLSEIEGQILDAYIESIEYFCPKKAAMARMGDPASRIMLIENNP